MRLKKRRIEAYGKDENRSGPTPLYQDIATMKEFGMTPAQWNATTRIDKKIMMYHRAAESYHLDIAQTNAKHKQKPPEQAGPRLKRG